MADTKGRIGDYKPANDMAQVLNDFQEIVNDKMYDYSFTYRVLSSKTYFGKTSYSAEWKGDVIGTGEFSIGSAERPWPEYVAVFQGLPLQYELPFHFSKSSITNIIADLCGSIKTFLKIFKDKTLFLLYNRIILFTFGGQI